ncbi:catalase [Frankia sp. B2]|uniref:catalase n=1 Tax=unclassified Frankia TaxID=2632575 RepID=UPI000461224D|nr:MULTISPECIES: catalase [unclassified Frankia]KDA42178.1 catalase [Frankia sp. BMG5.23]TFE26736.1 catalase [Frankia sp. B2]
MTDPGTSRLPRDDAKQQQLDAVRVGDDGARMTTDQGIGVEHTDDSLAAGERGPTLLEDFHFREKLTRFDHERIPERVVHARGAGAYGYFEAYESLADVTRAHFLGEDGRRTPVFVRFSTVGGSRGSADTVRDVRGFAVKFYTEEGNFDLVGNNMPVFFIQDGIKFPDFVHAVKPEPHNEIPQASSAHNTLWDFVSLVPESMHMMMWLMSDRALPRSYRMMQGFGVHTFRFVDAAGQGTFVKFHWRPKLGTHSLVWDETQKIAGKDPDFNRRDLWESIENGTFPEWELGVQLVPESDEHAFDFDLLDATKIIPEERVPVRPVGRLVLNRNPGNFFAETEQVAFCVQNVVPGIDFTNDPLLQARLFSYLDTQLIRLGGPNFAQLPVNRPVAAVHNNSRDGYGQHRIQQSQTSYFPNSISGGCPVLSDPAHGGYVHYAERVDGNTIRKRSESFKDFYSQATLFWNSMSSWERRHIVDAFSFELGKVDYTQIKERVLGHLAQVDHELAAGVAENLGLPVPPESTPNHGRSSPALSQADQPSGVATRRIAVLAADGVDEVALRSATAALREQGAILEVLAPHGGMLATVSGDALPVDRTLVTMSSVLYDAVFVAPGERGVTALTHNGEAVHYVGEAYKHAKPIGAVGAGVSLLEIASLPGARVADQGDAVVSDRGIVTVRDLAGPSVLGDFGSAFATAVAAHRHFDRALEAVAA